MTSCNSRDQSLAPAQDKGQHHQPPFPAGASEAEIRPYYRAASTCIYHDDFVTTTCIEKNSIDLIVTSPPYNLDTKYHSYNDGLSYERYLAFTRQWLARCLKLSKDDGRFCLNIPLDKNKGGQQSICADLTTLAKQVGWQYQSTIIWNEQNISRRTAWGSWLRASAPYVIAPVEVILVLYKKRWKKTSGSGESDIAREEFIAWTNGVWTFGGESGKRAGHPAPYPVELPRRCIKLFTFVGDTVLDPFLGSGSTLIACLETHRKGIGVEIDRGYCEIARQRLFAGGRNAERSHRSSPLLPLSSSRTPSPPGGGKPPSCARFHCRGLPH